MQSASIVQLLTDRFHTHKQNQFNGISHISNGSNRTPQWSLYFHMGRLVWAHSRLHPIRRWHRQLLKHCKPLVEAATTHDSEINYSALHYSKLVSRVRTGEINRIDMAKAVEDYLSEILFDIIHQGTLRHLQSKPLFALTDTPKRFNSSLFLIVRAEQAWQQTQYDWISWQQAELVKCSPNLAPAIGQADELKKRTSTAVFEHLIHVIDGKQTFRDLAVQLNQPLLPLTRRIVPYIRQGVMGLVRVNDFGPQVLPQNTSPTNGNKASTMTAPSTLHRAHTASAISESKGSAGKSRKQPSAKTMAEQQTSQGPETSLQSSAVARSQGQPPRSSAASSKLSKAPSNAPLIIYIDDSPMDSKIMGDILQDAGFRYRNIQESTHALPLLIEHKPQLIFLDLVMPVANGYEICSQVRRVSLFKNIPIVIVTSNDTISDRVRAKMVGATGFLKKPIQRSKVLKVIDKLIEGPGQNTAAAPRRSFSGRSPKATAIPKSPQTQAKKISVGKAALH